MKTTKTRCGFLAVFLLAIWLPAATRAAVIPDPGISQTLNNLFEKAPAVSGFPYEKELAGAAKRYHLPLPFVLAVARGESFFDPAAVSARGAVGIMQLMPETAADYGLTPAELTNPEKNIDAGVHLLADLHQQLKDPYLTLAAYYCGCGGVDRENFSLRADCDEYVRYINTHLQKIIALGTQRQGIPARNSFFILTAFDNFLDARQFIDLLNARTAALEIELLRVETGKRGSNPYHYRYQVLVSGKEKEMKVRQQVAKITGFRFER